MPAPLSGPGLGLPIPQNLYPTELTNAPYDSPGNRITLAPGDAIPLPAGNWYVSLGMYSILQFLDPQNGTWGVNTAAGWMGAPIYVKSDGFNVRVANLLGCPVGAVVASYGTGTYVQSSTTITPTPGNSTWLPIIGGQLALSGGTLTSNGAGYGVAPIVYIPPPPPAANNANGVGGIQATGYCTIASGTVSGFTFTNPGAGYPSAPTPVVLPNPTDPNLSTGITAATITFTLTNAGSLTGALCTNSGAPLANPANITLTITGAGSGASLTANVLQTVTAASVTGIGTGFGASATVLATTVGGSPISGSIANGPDTLHLSFRPRPANIGLTTTSGGTLSLQVGTIYDGGLFMQAPTAVLGLAASSGSLGAATLALTMGNVPDIVVLQPAP